MDSFATEVVLNKPDVTYDLRFIIKAEGIFIDQENINYRSHFDNRVAVILSKVSSEIGNGKILKGLSVKIQIPLRKDIIPYITSNIILKNTSIKNIDVPFLKSLGYKVTFNKIANTNNIILEKDKIFINVYDSIANKEEAFFNINITGTELLNDQVKSDLKAIINSLGLDEKALGELEANIIKSNDEVLVESVDVKKDEFDFKSAMKTELEWLKENGVIVGITEDDIESISSKSEAGIAGWNSRIIYDEKWILFSLSVDGAFINRGGCGGFEPVVLPDGDISIHVTAVTPLSKSTTKWGEIKTSI
jgi:hypothetical protein